ncbi:MAG: phosphoserine phosphatase SerB [Hyphomicrobiaceae bacterium]
MHRSALVFTTSPENAPLSGELLHHSRTLSELQEPLHIDWLNPGAACEILVSTMTDQLKQIVDDLRAEFADKSIDVNAVGVEPSRRKSLLIADMDSTIIEQECIDEIAASIGIGEQVAAITERAMHGEIEFAQALRERVGLLKGVQRDALHRILDERISIMPGAGTLVATMRAHGAFCALVSGGFTFFTEEIAHRVGFQFNNANQLAFDGDKLNGTVIEPILGREAKLQALIDLLQRNRLEAADSMAVGDGANDLAMISHAGIGAAYRAKPIVAAQADASIIHGDLTALLYLQGYRVDDFVTAKA